MVRESGEASIRSMEICSYCLHPKLGGRPTQIAMNHTPMLRPSTSPTEQEAQSLVPHKVILCPLHALAPSDCYYSLIPANDRYNFCLWHNTLWWSKHWSQLLPFPDWAIHSMLSEISEDMTPVAPSITSGIFQCFRPFIGIIGSNASVTVLRSTGQLISLLAFFFRCLCWFWRNFKLK